MTSRKKVTVSYNDEVAAPIDPLLHDPALSDRLVRLAASAAGRGRNIAVMVMPSSESNALRILVSDITTVQTVVQVVDVPQSIVDEIQRTLAVRVSWRPRNGL